MSAMKDLDELIAETITWSHRYEEIGDIIGNTDHIDDDHEPINDIEDAYINARVHREINAETIVDILHPEPFPNHDDFWHAIINVLTYIDETDVNEITIQDLQNVIEKGYQPCGR